jgi:hypothetical protein
MNESKILKAIRTEAGVVVSIVTIAIGIIFPYFGIKTDIALIQKDISIINTNHEAHIQDILTRMEKNDLEETAQNDRLEQMNNALIKLMQMHSK